MRQQFVQKPLNNSHTAHNFCRYRIGIMARTNFLLLSILLYCIHCSLAAQKTTEAAMIIPEKMQEKCTFLHKSLNTTKKKTNYVIIHAPIRFCFQMQKCSINSDPHQKVYWISSENNPNMSTNIK